MCVVCVIGYKNVCAASAYVCFVLIWFVLFCFFLQGRSSHPTICFNGNQGVREQNPPLTLPLL